MEALSWFVGHLIFAGVFGLLVFLRSKRAKWVGGKKVLAYPIALKVLILIGLLVLALGVTYVLSEAEGFELMFCAAILLPISGVYLLGCLELMGSRIAFDDAGVYQASLFTSTTYMSLADVVSVEYTEFWAQHVIRDDFGGCVRVSKFMVGAEELVGLAQAHLRENFSE